MIRVLQINKFYYPYIGGVEKVVQQISEELLKEPEVENSVLACHPERRDLRTCIRGVNAVLAGSLRTVLGMPISPSFRRLLAQEGNGKDIVDFHMPFPLAAWSLGALRSPGTKVVVHYHSDIVRQKKLKWAYASAFERLLSRADAVVVSSPNLRDSSDMLAPFRAKCRVIPFMAAKPDPEAVSPDRVSALKKEVGVPTGMPVVLYVGRLVYYKGLQYLMEAMAGVDAALLIVGSGPLQEDLRQQARSLGIEKRVYWRSGVSDEELPTYYALGDIFVLPSCANTEAYGIVQMEALVAGLPVINTSLPTGVPWVSKDGESGLTVPPGDAAALKAAICRLISDEALRNKLKAGALRRAEDFDPTVVRKQVMDLYREVLERP